MSDNHELIHPARGRNLRTLQAKTALFVAILDVGFLGAAILITRVVLHGDTVRIDVIGFLCAGLNIVMYGSPLTAMVRNSVLHLLLCYCFSFIYFFIFLENAKWFISLICN